MKYRFEQLLNRSYKAIQKRGLITDETNLADFILKADEEINEIKKAYLKEGNVAVLREIRQLMTVCAMAIMHSGLDPIKEFELEVLKNEHRSEN
jgi:hypothetical protein